MAKLTEDVARNTDPLSAGVRDAKVHIAKHPQTETLVDQVADFGVADIGNCCAGRAALKEEEGRG